MKFITGAASTIGTHAFSSRTARRCLHWTTARYAVTKLQMPAMSPTMTEGSIAEWKKKVGESFSAGDVLLEIETDKATIDVEAQDDGIMGKILTPDGTKNVPVGKVIALLAEVGDDISNIQVPKEEPAVLKEEKPGVPPSHSSTLNTSAAIIDAQPSHSKHPQHFRPLFPSVHRLLVENMIANPSVIKGTGVRGMLTKGDILAYLGKASGPMGTYKEAAKEAAKETKVEKKDEYKPLDGPAVRRLIVTTLLQRSNRARNAMSPKAAPDFHSVIADYLPAQLSSPVPKITSPSPNRKDSTANYFDGLM